MRCSGSALAIVVAATACSAGSVGPVDAVPPVDSAAAETRALGMNDVTMLVPLPADPDQPMLFTANGEGHQLVWHFHVDAVLGNDIEPKGELPFSFYDFHVVGVRFDLCTRAALGPCPAGADGELRLVFQPLYRNPGGELLAHDIGLHAFYPIPAAELPGVVGELRALARIQDAPLDGPLTVSPGLVAGTVEYRDRLRALIARYATRERLVRLTALGQEARSAAFAWVMRGGDIVDDSFVLTPIPDLAGANRQVALLAGGDTIFATEPVADVPAGFTTAINGAYFGEADAAGKRAALDALVAIQDPRRHGTSNTQCLGCHVATVLTERRAASLGLDPLALPERYSSTYNLSVDSISKTDARVVRGLGWASKFPAISQRVVNDTAAVLTEMEARFPPMLTAL